MILASDDNGNKLQIFAPDPTKTTTLTLTGGTATWTPAARTKAFMFYPSASVVMKLNSNTTGLTFDAQTLHGAFGLNAKTTSITFTGTADSTVVIEAD